MLNSAASRLVRSVKCHADRGRGLASTLSQNTDSGVIMANIVCFEPIGARDKVSAVSEGPLATAYLMRYSSIIKNQDKNHDGLPCAAEPGRCPALLVND